MGGTPPHHLQLKPSQRQNSYPHHGRRRRRRSPNHFPVGSAVEVRTDEEGFKSVFFSATVISPSPSSPQKKKESTKNSKKLYVEYHDLLAHEDRSDRLREYVDLSFVRPAPPFQEIVEVFKPDDVVDAFHKDGWWTGVVKRIVEGGERFVVTFDDPPDEQELGLSELRVHWDWVGGSWVREEKRSKAGMMFEVGRKVEVSFDQKDCQDAWFPATICEDRGNGAFLAEYQGRNSNNEAQARKVMVNSLHVRPCPPNLKDKNFVLLEKVDAYFDHAWHSGVITKELENSRYVVFFKQMKREREFCQSELRRHMDWKDDRWFMSSQSSQDVPTLSSNEEMRESNSPEDTNGTAEAVHVTSFGDGKDICDGQTPCLLNSADDQFEHLIPVDQESSPLTVSTIKRRRLSNSSGALSQPMKKLMEENVIGASVRDRDKSMFSGTPSPVSVDNVISSTMQTALGDQSSGNPSRRKRTGSEHLGTEGSREKKKRGRPRKSLLDITGTPLAGNARNGDADLDDSRRKYGDLHRTPEMVVTEMEASFLTPKKIASDKNKQNQPHSKYKRGSMMKKISTEMHHDKTIKDSTRLRETRSLERSCRRISREHTLLRVENYDASGGKTADVNSTWEAEKVVAEAPGSEFDNEPLSKWIEGMHSPPTVDGLRPSPVSSVVQCLENGERQRDAVVLEGMCGKQTPPLFDKGSIMLEGHPSLPFAKNTVLWETIASMEAFRRMPQKPHFKPLEHVKESSREGLAIGYMVTFSSVVEKVSRLQFDDPTSVTDEILETLVELEKHGFDVVAIRDRVVELLAVKDKSGKLDDEISEISKQISEHSHEKSRIEEEISGITEQIQKWQEKLSHVESAKEKEDCEIALLQARLQEVEESMVNVGREFESLASARI